MSTDLEKAADRTPAVITTPDEYRSALLRWQQHNLNILTPFTNVSGLAAQHGIITSTVLIQTDKAAEEVYDGSGGMPFLKDGEVALAKRGLRKIAECAGISTSTLRTDPRTIPHYWEMKAIATYRGIDGAIVTREATAEWDLRDGSDRLKGFKTNQITEARKNGLRNCESRAINAVIRECGCGLKQKYTRAELAKPFVVCRVMFQPDMTDPETRRMVTERALGGTNAMYPPPRHEVIDVTAEPVNPATPPASSTAAPAATTTGPDAPPTPDAVKIKHAEVQSGIGKNNKPYKKSVVIDHNGVEYSSFDLGHVEDALRFKAANEWVEINHEQNGQYLNIIEIVKAQPSLLPDPSAL